eukprot:m.414558 g.414558  ORF g.414558 m.414558 type:complete len:252 (+) comp29370_c0_seq1:319-1074(+)
MKIIPPLANADEVENVEEYLQNLRDNIADGDGDGGDGAGGVGGVDGRGREPHPRNRGAAARSSTPRGGISSSRSESVQRRKAEGSRPGSRRERRWMNRAALHPSPEDVELDASPLSVVPSLFLQLPHLEAIDEWEANQEQGTPPCLAIAIARVDRNLRPLLRRAPKSLIASIEQDLRESFTNDAESVYIETCDCWNRALLHAVSRYLGLNSMSETVDGQRVTTVSNPHETFSPPQARLAARRPCVQSSAFS